MAYHFMGEKNTKVLCLMSIRESLKDFLNLQKSFSNPSISINYTLSICVFFLRETCGLHICTCLRNFKKSRKGRFFHLFFISLSPLNTYPSDRQNNGPQRCPQINSQNLWLYCLLRQKKEKKRKRLCRYNQKKRILDEEIFCII